MENVLELNNFQILSQEEMEMIDGDGGVAFALAFVGFNVSVALAATGNIAALAGAVTCADIMYHTFF